MTSQEKVSEKVQIAIFNQILNSPANSECADCGTRDPNWVSLDFGVFVCMRCSGVHRQLGPHISRVRSVKLDGWTKDNIEIMAKVGNRVANAFYENKMSAGYRKPGTNSTPEECRRFVDEKYIKKAFVPAGYQEPVKELIASRKNGTDPDFGYSQQKQNKQPEPVQPVVEAQPKNQSAFKFIRKKSMSLDRANDGHQEKKPVQNHQQNHHHQDLLSGDDDLLGSDPAPVEKLETHSASPVKGKINFANFKKAQSQPGGGMHHSNSQPEHLSAAWELEASQPANNTATTQNQAQDNKVDVMKLYSQPQGHQNHFMQQNWYNNGWNNGMNQNFNGGFQGGFPQQNYQGFQGNPNMGYNPYMNHMAGPNFSQGHMQNQFNNNGFVQAPGPNKYF